MLRKHRAARPGQAHSCEAQRVLAPAIPFAWSDELRFSPQEEKAGLPRRRSANSRVSEVDADQHHNRDEGAADYGEAFQGRDDFVSALAGFNELK